MVCAGISLGYQYIYRRVSKTAARYRDKVLDPLELCDAAVVTSFFLIDDHASPHSFAIVFDFLKSGGIAYIEWPGYLSNNNTIKNLWNIFGVATYRRLTPSSTMEDLETTQQEEWRLPYPPLVTSMITSCIISVQMRNAHVPY